MPTEQEQPFNYKIVTIGGGTGHFSLLRGLVSKNNPENITAVFGTWDSGGSSGDLRTEEGILPPGDYMKCILGLMEDEDQLQAAVDILNDRDGSHPLCNLLGAKAEKKYHGVEGGIDGIRKLLRIKGRVIPITLVDLKLFAETKKGEILEGEHEIDHLKDGLNFMRSSDEISKIYFNTRAKANPRVIDAINDADAVIMAPGSPYTSILASLLVNGISEAIMKSKAKLVIVSNLMTTSGEDHHLKTTQKYLEEVQRYLRDDLVSGKSRINLLIANKNGLKEKDQKDYEEKGQCPVIIDENTCRMIAPGIKIIVETMAQYDDSSHLFRHNRPVLAENILQNLN